VVDLNSASFTLAWAAAALARIFRLLDPTGSERAAYYPWLSHVREIFSISSACIAGIILAQLQFCHYVFPYPGLYQFI
jgi:hypothetical protein